MSKGRSNKDWLRQRRNDTYVKLARSAGYRSRAAYKLIELDKRDHILQAGSIVVELGAAPGGWSQVVAERIGARGRLLMVDILPIAEVPGADFVQGDFAEEETLTQMLAWLGAARANVILSDMAPNLSGIKSNDQARSLALAELAFESAKVALGQGGCLLVKVFQGPEVRQFSAEIAKFFRQVVVRKPSASRSESGEIYLLGKQFFAAE